MPFSCVKSVSEHIFIFWHKTHNPKKLTVLVGGLGGGQPDSKISVLLCLACKNAAVWRSMEVG